MVGLALLLGHLVGDYIAQNDFLAKNKANPHPGPEPAPRPDGTKPAEIAGNYIADAKDWVADAERRQAWRLGHLACTAHCLLYTLAVWAFTFAWMPWWSRAGRVRHPGPVSA